MEKILDDISFEADTLSGQSVEVDSKLVDEKLGSLVESEDTTRYIL